MNRMPRHLASTVDVTPFSKLTLLRKIGHGGFGEVYHARHRDWSEVAYKRLVINFIKPDERVAHELKGEVAIHIHLRHPNIVTLIGVVFEPKNYGVVLEYAPHGDLLHFLTKFRPVHWAWKLHVAYEVSLGLNYLHTARDDSSVIHGDVKIKNVLIGHGYRAKISDFGLSRWKQYSSEVTGRDSGGGTVTHIPPENWRDINLVRSTKFDVYGFGVLLWEMFSERKPFEKVMKIKDDVVAGKRPATRLFLDDVPDYVKEITSHCWAQEPDDRPAFSTIKDRLDRWCRQLGDYIHEAERSLQRKEHAGPAAASTSQRRAAAVARRPTGSATPVQDNYYTHTEVQVQDPGSAGFQAQVTDRSGVPSVREPSIDIQAQRHQEMMPHAVDVARPSETESTLDSFTTTPSISLGGQEMIPYAVNVAIQPETMSLGGLSGTHQPIQATDLSSRSLGQLQLQTAQLQISDDQRPLADRGTLFQPMETTEAGHVVPRGDGSEVDMELADTPMDSAADEFVTARASPVSDASISTAHLPSY